VSGKLQFVAHYKAPMKTRYIVSYDISDPKRLRQVHKTMLGYGEPLQYSVFCCDLAPAARIMLIADLSQIIDHREDQIMLIDIGPAEGRGKQSIETVGRAMNKERLERRSVIV
jgi:CRISPR-associated protein Cas2